MKGEQDLPPVSRNIRRLRKYQRLTQEELAELAGISSVKMIESGKNIGRVPTLMAIAKALGCSLDDLFYDANKPMPVALKDFLQSPLADGVTAEEVEELMRVRGYGKQPTETSYYFALRMLRSMSEPKP